MQVLFLMATERSGSNLLRSLMDRHPAISAPSAPQFLKAVLPYRSGDLPFGREDAATLAALLVRLTQLHPAPWRPAPEPSQVLAAAQLPSEDRMGPDFFDLFDAFYRLHAVARGKDRYFVKENDLFRYAEVLAARFPTARFLHLVRDPRDVFASYKKVPGGPNLATTFVELWCREQHLALEAENRFDLVWLRYEDLTARPAEVLSELLSEVGLDFDPGMLRQPEEDGPAKSASPYFRNLGRPVLAGKSGKYRRVLTAQEIAVVEDHCGELMQRFGYAPESGYEGPRIPRAMSSSRLALPLIDKLLTAGKATIQIQPAELRLRLRRKRCYRRIRRLLRKS